MQELKLWSRERAKLFPLPMRDRLAFMHLVRILQRGLPLVLSDGEHCLAVQQEAHLPMWVWTDNRCPDETLHALLLSLSALREQNRLDAVVSKNALGRLLSIAFRSDLMDTKRISVYRMQEPVPFTADGGRIKGALVPPEKAGELIKHLLARDGISLSAQEKRDNGILFTTDENAYAWRTADGQIASIARLAVCDDRYTDVNTVVTAPSLQNCGYARALLYSLTSEIAAGGRIPMLYADRSNEIAAHVYSSLGFREAATLTALRFLPKE